MLLRNAHVDFMESINEFGDNYNYCICLSCNKMMQVFFLEKMSEYNIWKRHLSGCCILSGYGKNYQNLRVIGKGNFAKVVLAKRLSDGAEFAVKVFDKMNI